jgi:hypothetical protein
MEDSRSAIQRELDLMKSDLAAPDGRQKILTAHIYRILALTKLAEVDGDDPHSVSLKRTAIELLGVLRADVAVPVLVEQIDFRDGTSGTVSRIEGYPAAQALCQIGTAARRGILARLRRDTPTAEQLELFAWVLAYIDDGLEFAKQRLEYLLDRRRQELQSDAKRAREPVGLDTYAANLERLIDFYKDEITNPARPGSWERDQHVDKQPRRPQSGKVPGAEKVQE